MSPAPRSWHEAGLTLGAGALVLAFCLALLARDPGYFWHDDFQSAGMGVLWEVARCLREGEWPLVSDHSWFAGSFAGDYQPGVFNLVSLLAASVACALPLGFGGQAAAYTLPFVAITAMGSFRLARSYALAPGGALLVAVVASLNGMLLAWGATDWTPLVVSFAWLPWLWWAQRRALRPEASAWATAAAGGFLYLLLTAGWPFTDIMAAGITAFVAARTLASGRGVAALWPLGAAWLLGLALAAPALLVFVEHIGASVRGVTAVGALDWNWLVPLSGLWGFVLPSSISIWPIPPSPRFHLPIELANGLVPTAAVVALLASRHRRELAREHGWELALLFGLLLAVMLPALGNFRWSFRWLPLLHLVAALVAAQVLQRRDPELAPLRDRPGAWGVAVAGVGGLHGLLHPVVSNLFSLGMLAIALAWAGTERLGWRLAPAITLAALGWTYYYLPVSAGAPTWQLPEALRQSAPLSHARRYLALPTMSDYFSEQSLKHPFGLTLRPGNTAQLAHLDFINGYSPTYMRGFQHLFGLELALGPMNPDNIRYVLARELDAEGLLAYMAVDGVILGSEAASHASATPRGWVRATHTREGLVWHRAGAPLPRVRALPRVHLDRDEVEVARAIARRPGGTPPLELVVDGRERPDTLKTYAPVALRLVFHNRSRDTVDVTTSPTSPGLVLFSRAWYPGFRAWLDGQELPVRVFDNLMPAVELPPGVRGRLELAYRPRSLELGLWLAAVAPLVILPGLGYLERRRKAGMYEEKVETEGAEAEGAGAEGAQGPAGPLPG